MKRAVFQGNIPAPERTVIKTDSHIDGDISIDNPQTLQIHPRNK